MVFVLSAMFVDYNSIKTKEYYEAPDTAVFQILLDGETVSDLNAQKIFSCLQNFTDLDESVSISSKTSDKILSMVNIVEPFLLKPEQSQTTVYIEDNKDILCGSIIVNYIHQKDGKKFRLIHNEIG